jgi:ketosteroid isomerase-like protein
VSQQNVEVVRTAWEHFLETGEPFEEAMAPDFVWVMSTFRDMVGLQNEYLGADGMRQFMREWTEGFEAWSIEVEDMIDAGDQVITVCTQHARAKASGLTVDMRLAMVFTVRDGLETRMEMYADPAEALKAVGLEQ